MTSIPRPRRPVLGIGLCLLFLLHLIFLITEGDAFATGLIPFYVVLSNAPVVFLLPAFVLFSTTPPPAPRPRPTPAPVPHVFDPLKPRWIVSHEIIYNDEQTLHNLAIGRPLNGTGKCVTKKVFTWFDPKEFPASPFSEDDDAPIEAPVYTIAAPPYIQQVPSRMLDLTAWRRVRRVGLLGSRAITRVRPRTRHALVQSRAARNQIIRNSEQFASIFKMNIVWLIVVGVFKATWLIATRLGVLVVLYHLAPLVILCLVRLRHHLIFSGPPINKPSDLYRAVFILARIFAEELWSGLKSMVVALVAPRLRAIGFIKIRPKFVPERLFTPEEAEAFREDHKDSLPTPSLPLTIARLRGDNIVISRNQRERENGITYSKTYRALDKRLKLDDPPPVEPSFISPLGAQLYYARRLLSQIEVPFVTTPHQPTPLSMPPRTADEAQQATIKRLIEGSEEPGPPMKITPEMGIDACEIPIPLETYEEFLFLTWKRPGEHPPGRPAKREDVKTGASGTSPPNTTYGPFTASPHPLPAVDPTTSSATLPKPTEESSAKDAKGKNKQDPTPTPSEPSEHTNSGAGLAGQASEEIFDESLLETPRPGCYSLSSPTKGTSQASNPGGSQRSDVRPATQVSGAGSYLSTPQPGCYSLPSAIKNTSQASNPRGPQQSDVRPAAQVSGAGSYIRTPKPVDRSLPAVVDYRWQWRSSSYAN